MDVDLIEKIIYDLNDRPAAELESQVLEFKGWCRDQKELSNIVCKAAVGFANSDGGLIIIGVDDKKIGSSAISQCPYNDVTADWLSKRMRDLTKPPINCKVTLLGDVLTSKRGTKAAELIIVEVKKTNHPSGHRTLDGVSYIRIDTECRRDYLVDSDDYSALSLEKNSIEDLNQDSVKAAIKSREKVFPDVKGLGLRTIDHLMSAGLLRESHVPSIAAFLLFGKEEKIKQEFPAAETILIFETVGVKPFTSSNWYSVFESVNRYLPLIKEKLLAYEADIPSQTIRELLLNAYLHRCYRTTSPIQIRIAKSEFEIRNPGSLLGELTPHNLLYSPPIYRNFTLADGARQLGLCEKAGIGLDKVYNQLIVQGLYFPYFESKESSFKAIIKTTKDQPFARLIRDCAGTLNLTLTDLIVLRILRTKRKADIEDLASAAQRPIEYMIDALDDLEQRNLIEKIGTPSRFRLADATLSQLAAYGDGQQLRLL